jgi:hypothetical protein
MVDLVSHNQGAAMWKKVLIVGATTAAIVGAGTAAVAVTGNSSPSPSPSTSGSTGPAHHAKAGASLRHTLHGSYVTKAGKGATGFVTHDAIRGTVTAVSPTSITVKAADGYSQTYAVTSSTVEHLKSDGKGKGTAGQISQVKVGDKAGVVGTGTSAPTATHIIDVGVGTTTTS